MGHRSIHRRPRSRSRPSRSRPFPSRPFHGRQSLPRRHRWSPIRLRQPPCSSKFRPFRRPLVRPCPTRSRRRGYRHRCCPSQSRSSTTRPRPHRQRRPSPDRVSEFLHFSWSSSFFKRAVSRLMPPSARERKRIPPRLVVAADPQDQASIDEFVRASSRRSRFVRGGPMSAPPARARSARERWLDNPVAPHSEPTRPGRIHRIPPDRASRRRPRRRSSCAAPWLRPGALRSR
jgi:hypothetical protein